MGAVSFSGQTIRFVGGTRLSVSNTKLSAAANVNRMFAGENITDPALITYIPGLPDFLQGFTHFVPGSTYMVFARGVSSMPIELSPGGSFIPPVSSSQEELAGRFYSGVSFFVSTSVGSSNVFTGQSMVLSAFNRLSAANITSRIFQVRPVEGGYSLEDARHFLKSFVESSLITMHIAILSAGSDPHHLLEAIFKAAAGALDEATQIDLRRKGVPSTKGGL